MPTSAILLVSCPDRRGIVASIADFIFRHNGNILFNDEHGDEESNLFLHGSNLILRALILT